VHIRAITGTRRKKLNLSIFNVVPFILWMHTVIADTKRATAPIRYRRYARTTPAITIYERRGALRWPECPVR
jgi:hypothetical protein